MSDNFKIIDSSPSIAEINAIITATNELGNAWVKLLPQVKAVTEEMAKGTPKEYSEALKQSVTLSKQLEKVSKDLTDAQVRLQKVEQEAAKTKQQLAKATYEEERAKQANLRTQSAEITLKQKLENLDKKEQQRLANAASLYSKIEQKLKMLQLEYRDLAAAKELGIKLTNDEANRMEFLQGKIKKYDTALKTVDASMGKHQRNVGDYARANNGLGMSLAQITREMPAFANSAQTGFMALSNNIPIFFDAIGQVKNLNKELQAQGKPTVSVLQQLAGAFFSWQTALSVGVTLLTVYGADMWKWAKSMYDSTNLAAKSMNELNEATKKSMKDISTEITQLEILYRVATNEALSREQRLRATDKLQKLYPSYFKSLTDEQIMLGKGIDKYNELRNAIIASAKARAAEGILAEKTGKLLENQAGATQDVTENLQKIKKLQDFLASGQKRGTIDFGFFSQDYTPETAKKAIANFKKQNNEILKGVKNEAINFKKENAFIINTIQKNQEIALPYEADKYGADPTSLKTQKTPKKPKSEKPAKDVKDDLLERYRIEKENIDNLYKVKEEAYKNELELEKENLYNSEVQKIEAQGKIYDKLIDLNEDYYKALIDNAKKYGQPTFELESARDIQAGNLQTSKTGAFNKMPEAVKKDYEYTNNINKLAKEAGDEEGKRLILSNKKLTVKQREYLLSLNELETQKENLILDKTSLENRQKELLDKAKTGKLTRDEKKEWAEISAKLGQIDNQILGIGNSIDKLQTSNLKENLLPLKDIISEGLGNLGLGSLTDEFDNLFNTVLDKEATFLEKFNAGLQLIGEYGKILVDEQLKRQLSALDEQLEASRNATEQELGFIDKRLEYFANMENMTKEQIAERNALEDEARAYREQQEQREKLIATRKAKAEQRASANKALIGGLQGAATSIANLGLPAGLPFAVASVAMGAIMAGLIMSKNPIPQYFVGREGGRAEYALTQERGAEAIVDKKGRVKTWGNDKGAQLTWLDEGDSVLTASETLNLKRNSEPFQELDYNFYRNNAIKGIKAPIIINNADNSDAIAEKVGNKFDKIMSKYDKEHVFELNGMIYSQKGGQYPICIGRAKKNTINVNVNRNVRN